MTLSSWNILDLIAGVGEETVNMMIEPFSCVKSVDDENKNLNPDIENFLKENAIQFAKEKKSITYLVGDEESGEILGYFTLAHKAVVIPADGLSTTTIKRMNRYAQLNETTNTLTVSGFLIAQLGKNYAIEDGNLIKGTELMHLARNELLEIQYRAGGGLIYLDCEADARLIDFYENEGFKLFGERISQHDGKRYLQYMKFV